MNAIPFTPDRAREILEASRSTMPWSDGLRRNMTPGEVEFVREVWGKMPGYTAFVDAFLRIMRGEPA